MVVCLYFFFYVSLLLYVFKNYVLSCDHLEWCLCLCYSLQLITAATVLVFQMFMFGITWYKHTRKFPSLKTHIIWVSIFSGLTSFFFVPFFLGFCYSRVFSPVICCGGRRTACDNISRPRKILTSLHYLIKALYVLQNTWCSFTGTGLLFSCIPFVYSHKYFYFLWWIHHYLKACSLIWNGSQCNTERSM